MSSKRVVVRLDPTRDDSFVLVPQDFLHNVVAPQYAEIPAVIALELTTTSPSDSAGGDARPKGASKLYVGCITSRPAAPPHQSNCIVFAPTFAADLQLAEGELLHCTALVGTPNADKVLVSPSDVDESEIVEHNALQIESTLLRKLRVVAVAMRATVVIHRGLRAQLIVDRIDLSGTGLHQKCAFLTEGTELHVATRSRAAEKKANSAQPEHCIVRAYEKQRCSSEMPAPVNGDVIVPRAVAAGRGWTEGTAVGILHVAAMAWSEDMKLPPSVIRSTAVLGRLRIAPIQVVNGDPCGVCLVGYVGPPTTLFVFPEPPSAISKNVDSLNAAAWATPSSIAQCASLALPTTDLAQVHGEAVVLGLLHYLTVLVNSRQRLAEDTMSASHNILLLGGKGGGKSTVAVSAALGVARAHVVYIDCAVLSKEKNVLGRMHRTFLEAALCAPSIVVLDNLESIAPAQQEGNNAAMTHVTEAALEAMLTALSSRVHPGLKGTVTVVATSTSLEALHESVRSAMCFTHIEKLEPLNVASRTAMVRQVLSSATRNEFVIKTIAKLTDNCSPFDLQQLCQRRVARALDEEGRATKKQLAAIVNDFTPLAYSGTQFLAPKEKKTWEDIGGMHEAKKALHDALVLPLKFPKLFDKLPLKTRSGVLLFGPPGCGKSYVLSSVVAAEGLHCILVNGPEIFGKYIGQSEQRVREIFEKAQAAAPSVVFFDEFDSVAPQRGHDNTGVTDRVVNQLLCYLDGVEARKNVFVVAASSRPDLIDAALLRPGRLDRAVLCPMPDACDRKEILQAHCRNINCGLTDEDIDTIVLATENWTCADLAGLVSSASLIVVQQTIDMSKELAALNIGGGADGTAATALDEEALCIVANCQRSQKASVEKIKQSISEASKTQASSSSGGGGSSQKKAGTSFAQPAAVSMAHFMQAMTTTRRSTTDADLAKQRALYNRFMQSREPGGAPAIVPGTRVTSA